MTMVHIDASNMHEAAARLRKEAGFGTRRLATESGVNVATISRFENKLATVNIVSFIKMMNTMGYALVVMKKDKGE